MICVGFSCTIKHDLYRNYSIDIKITWITLIILVAAGNTSPDFVDV